MKKQKKLPKVFNGLALILASLFIMTSAVQADILYTGDVYPDDPATWTSSTKAYIGYSDEGSVTINNGSTMAVSKAYFGYEAGSEGTINVDGSGSSLTSSGTMFIGRYGNGYLNITDGATVTQGATTYLACYEGAAAALTISGAGSSFSSSSPFYAAHKVDTSAQISILDGGSMTSSLAYLGEVSDATAIIDGEGSSWEISRLLYTGSQSTGAASIFITNGGSVATTASDSVVYLGYASGSTTRATIDGEGSSLGTDNKLYVGYNGQSSLTVANGGAVTAGTVSINSSSAATVDVNSSLSAGSDGTITNNGTLRLVAGASATSGSYNPLTYGTLTGEGTILALGGVLDAATNTVTVYDAVTNAAGSDTVSLDLSSRQRALITDSSTGMSAGAGFLAATASTEISFTAAALSGTDLTGLETALAGGDYELLSAWVFSTEGYTVSEESPVYLSLYADADVNLSDLTVWYLNDGTWVEYDAEDLNFSGTYASFTATELGSYAVTAASSVPVPGAFCLLGAGLLGLAGMRRKIKA